MMGEELSFITNGEDYSLQLHPHPKEVPELKYKGVKPLAGNTLASHHQVTLGHAASEWVGALVGFPERPRTSCLFRKKHT